jgi:energy-converting hydrogenase Eha subunit C
MWWIPLIIGVVLVIGGVAMLLHAQSLNKTLPPKGPDGVR